MSIGQSSAIWRQQRISITGALKVGILERLAVLGQDQWWPDDSPNGQGEEDWKRVQDVEVDLCRSEFAIVSLSVLDDSEDRSHLTRRGSVLAPRRWKKGQIHQEPDDGPHESPVERPPVLEPAQPGGHGHVAARGFSRDGVGPLPWSGFPAIWITLVSATSRVLRMLVLTHTLYPKIKRSIEKVAKKRSWTIRPTTAI